MMEPRSIVGGLRLLVQINLLLVASLLLARATAPWWRGSRRGQLRLAQAAFVLAFALPLLVRALPQRVLLAPAVQVWSSGDLGHPPEASVTYVGTAASPGMRRSLALDDRLLALAVALAAVAATARLSWLGVRLLMLRRTLDVLPSIRRIGRVAVVATAGYPVPFSAWLFGRAYVAIPEDLACDPRGHAIALRHELAHHRQRDTIWIQLFEACSALTFWNPATRAWSRHLTELMELACDEALVLRRRVDPHAYARCLVKTARAALPRPGQPSLAVGAAGMAATTDTFLKRRIEIMLAPATPSAPRLSAVLPAAALLALAGTAFALQSSIQDRVIGMEQARELAARASSPGFPVVINEQVLARLNRLVGTPEGREFLGGALARMPEHRATIEKRLSDAGIPPSLVAIALVESGFRNNVGIPSEPTAAPGMRGAGIWMFIPATARRYGLRVEPAAGIDERLDVAKETGAAIAYLSKLHREFGDWQLALAAYNQGESHVQRAHAEGGVRDAFVLAEQGRLNDYVATVMAGVVVIANPEIVD